MNATLLIVSPLWLLVLLLLPLTVYFGFRMLLGFARKEQGGRERDWSVPQIEFAGGDSPVHRWDIRFKLASFLFVAFLAVSLKHPQSAAVAVLLALIGNRMAAIPWRRGLKRLVGMTGFLSMFLLMLPLTAVHLAGDQLIGFNGLGWLTFNLRGLDLALLIILRAASVALLMEPLLATAPLPETLAGLSRMGVPQRISELLLISHRYLYVFMHEARRMQIGMDVRGFHKATNMATLRSVGNYVGMLFVRSFERTERVHMAMLARGYQGTWPQPFRFKSCPADYLKTLLVVGCGLLLVIWDQLLPAGF
ncbi:cobalt ECF transporter T component CbiQ [Geopsychrobacter electrodiphilus]|uniref:cobalt ECF transporter T component CbiQ n=1 Tax=Geopsychrobacter electrodiphilus TaxID=225196 RepID=UPI0003628229|nr:cobalt ECF transporter T component CbiQ [Geopsychrobacter electrodiphilus]